MQVQPNLGQNIIGLGGNDSFPPSLMIPSSNPEGIFTLSVAGVVGTNGYVAPLLKNGDLYQVTAGKTCKVLAVIYWGGGVGIDMQLLSSTATFAYDGAVGTLTGPKYQAGGSGRYVFRTVTANVVKTYSCQHDFAATTWPGVQIGTSGVSFSVMLIVKEV